MTCKSLRFLFASTLTLSLALTACGDPRTDTASATAASESSGGSTSETPTTGGSTGVPTTSDGSATGGGSTTSDTSVTGGMTTAPVCNDPPSQPNNSDCTEDCGCESMHCFNYVLGALCGECNVDADCPAGGGCSVPNPFMGTGSTCNMGMPGDGCQTDAICKDPSAPICGTVVNAAPILSLSTCGQCKVNADCANHPGGPNCTPTVDIPNFKGQLACVMDGSVENDQPCSLEDVGGMPAGNTACKSGFCGEATFMSLVKFGVCGECLTDADCAMGQTCTTPMIDEVMYKFIGSVCQ